MTGKLLGLYVLLLASLASQAYVQSNDHRHIGTLEHMLLRQNNHGKRIVLDSTSSSACAPADIKPVEGSRCTMFVTCLNGQWYHEAKRCPPNLLWNGDKSSCDYAVNVDVSTCTSRHHKFNSHTPSTNFPSSGSGTIAPISTAHPTTTESPTHVPQHGLSCGHYECFNGSCQSHSHCHNSHCESYHSCGCYNGYVGDNCNQRLSTATHCKEAGLNCHHGCVYDTVQSEYACHCNPGYMGRHCSLQKTQESHCWNSSLQCHHGECVHEIGHSNYACHCTPEYTGKQCVLRIVSKNECTRHGFRCIHGQCLHDTSSDNSARSYSCDCHHGYTGAHCDNQKGAANTTTPTTSAHTTTTAAPTPTQTTTAKLTISTSTAAPTTSTHSTTKDTTVPIHYYTCDKVATVINLVNQIPVNDTTGGSCPSGSSATPEAFVLDHCNVTSSSKWTQGVNIMKQCDDIPVYTPVATFSNQRYASSGGLSGIFLGCLPHGFKLGVQQCGNLPTIIHVNYGGLFTMNPDLYFTVQ